MNNNHRFISAISMAIVLGIFLTGTAWAGNPKPVESFEATFSTAHVFDANDKLVVEFSETLDISYTQKSGSTETLIHQDILDNDEMALVYRVPFDFAVHILKVIKTGEGTYELSYTLPQDDDNKQYLVIEGLKKSLALNSTVKLEGVHKVYVYKYDGSADVPPEQLPSATIALDQTNIEYTVGFKDQVKWVANRARIASASAPVDSNTANSDPSSEVPSGIAGGTTAGPGSVGAQTGPSQSLAGGACTLTKPTGSSHLPNAATLILAMLLPMLWNLRSSKGR